MPVYEFYCKNCNLKYEEIREIGANYLECPICKKKTKKLISRVFSNFSPWKEKEQKLQKWANTPESM